MTHFVYLHGFNSGYDPTNEKIKALEQIGTVSGITYDTFAHYPRILTSLLAGISYSDELVMVGTSLGGYWAARVAENLKVPSVIINPVTDPATSLAKYQDINCQNYTTGKDNSLNEFAVTSYRGHELSNDVSFYYKPLVLCDRGDAVLSCTATENVLSDMPMHTFQGGNHRFSHMQESLELIQNYVRTCDIVEPVS